MNEFLITFRETLEGSLIVGIVYTFLVRMDVRRALGMVWLGLGAALAASVLFGLGLFLLKEQGGAYKPLLEAILMYAAAGFLLSMVVWMARNTNIKGNLEAQARAALEGSGWGIFSVVFFAITREGFETALFLLGSTAQQGGFSWLGAVLGITLAVALGGMIFRFGQRIQLKPLFRVSSVLLVVMAAGMVAYGTHELEEYLVHTQVINEAVIARPYDILRPTSDVPSQPAWYTFNETKGKYIHILHDNGSVGVFIKGFLGYNSNPNWVEFLAWIITLVGGYRLWSSASSAPRPILATGQVKQAT
jgi:high-affinity iron transporter